MAYSDDQARAKLSSLNESQESVMMVGQWFMFFRRYATRIAALWSTHLRTVQPPKRLNLIYLVNEVVQKEKGRGKEEFPRAFAPVIADGLAEAYTGASTELKAKLRRVVAVWRDRNVFAPDVQSDVERRIAELDKGKGTKGKLGGSLFASGSSDGGVPPELKDLAALQTNLTKASIESVGSARDAASSHDTTLSALADGSLTLPVQAARLSHLLTSLTSAQSALQTTLAARDALLANLEAFLNANRAERDKEAAQLADLATKREKIQARNEESEKAILRGATEVPPSQGDEDIPRPEMEPLTPPGVESLTPPPPPAAEEMPVALEEEEEEDDDDGAQTPPGSPLLADASAGVVLPPNYAMGDPRRRTAGGVDGASGTKRGSEAEDDGKVNGVGAVGAEDPRRKSYENMTFKRRKTSEDVVGAEALEGLDDELVGDLG